MAGMLLTWIGVDTVRHCGLGILGGRKGHQRVWKDRPNTGGDVGSRDCVRERGAGVHLENYGGRSWRGARLIRSMSELAIYQQLRATRQRLRGSSWPDSGSPIIVS